MINDLIVIGGGAAGLCAAVYFKQNNPDKTVRILESQPRVGKKLAVTGNGRCNITNIDIDISHYHGKNVAFCRYALEKYNHHFTENFFKSIGVDFIFEDKKGFPSSFQATSVVDCLRFACEELGIIINLEMPVTNIQTFEKGYKIISNQLSFFAENVIIATGLLSGGDRYGCNGKMLNLLKKADYKIVEPAPAIVQIKTDIDVVKQLKGIKINAKATLNGKSALGEVLFTDYGLSGPPILQVSRNVNKNTVNQKISLDIMPDKSFNELNDLLSVRVKNLKKRTLEEFFTGMLQKRIGQVLLKQIGCKLSDGVETLSNQNIKSLVSLMKNWTFNVTGTTGFLNSQVSAGGLDTNGFTDTTMESKSSKGIYCVGEILDIDGDCGGFNLQWAWSSAFCAAEAIKGKNK